jgi:hypothetical protein
MFVYVLELCKSSTQDTALVWTLPVELTGMGGPAGS